MSTFHKLKTVLLAATLAMTAISAQAETQPLDQVIAIVEDDVILASEVGQRMQQVMGNIEKSGKAAPPVETIQQQVLDMLILENIQMQMAHRAGVRVSDAQLNDSMTRIAAQNRMNLEQFKAALETDGLSYHNTREQVRREMLLQRVQQGNVNQRVQITDQEISNFLASEEGQSLTAPEYNVIHALIPVASDADSDAINTASAYANKVYKRVKAGADVKTATADSPYPLNASNLGWRKASDLPSVLANVVPGIERGEIIEPIRSPSGYHLVKLADKRGEGEMIPQTRARHILLKPSAIRDEQQTEVAANRLRQRVSDGEDFASLAREHSEDIGSALEGGDLGWTNPGQLVPAFEKTMANTEAGSISPAFRSRYGWHILQVQERRQKDVTEDMRRNLARKFIHQRKFDDELQVWLQKIRDEAYVDLK